MKSLNFVAALAISLLFLASFAYAAPSKVIPLQGKLTQTNGVPYSGSYSMTFKVFDVATSGSALYTETISNIPVSAGLFSVILGESSPLTLSFDKDYYIEITIGSETLSPRQRLLSAPYSIYSTNSAYSNTSSYAANAGTSNFATTAQNIQGGTVNATSGTFSSNVGIGINNPSSKLHISSGTIKATVGENPGDSFSTLSGNMLTVGESNMIPDAPYTSITSSQIIVGNTFGTPIASLGSGNSYVMVERFGIGTTNPTETLQVVSPSLSQRGIYWIDGSNTDLKIYRDSDIGNWSLLRSDIGNGIAIIGSADVPVLTVSRISNNVGIGTISPTTKLDVAGNVKATGLCIGNDCKTSWPSSFTLPQDLQVISLNSTITRSNQICIGGDCRVVWPNSPITWMPIGSNTYFNGSVGIGTQTPSAKLDINGTVRISNGQYYNDFPVTIDVPSNQQAPILRVAKGGAVIDVIDSNGNVGIGTATPTEKLEIVGNVKTTGLCLGSDCRTTWPTASGNPSSDNSFDGAISFFASTTCPTGWTEYTPLRGRYVVGLPSGGASAGIQGTALTNLENRPIGQHTHATTDPGHTHGTNLWSAGGGAIAGSWTAVNRGGELYTGTSYTGISVNNAGSVSGTNAPYVQLIACQRTAPIPTTGGSGASSWTQSGTNIYYNSGNVGIGTTSPDANVKLHVSGGGIGIDNNKAIWAKTSFGTMSDIVRLDTSNKLNIRGVGGGLAVLDSGGNPSVTVTNAGNVGIGTTAPTTKLDVNGPIKSTGTGGNVPHACTVRSDSNSNNNNVAVSCNAGEIATGGGGACSETMALRYTRPVPQSGTPTGWEVYYPSSCITVTAYAVCCQV